MQPRNKLIIVFIAVLLGLFILELLHPVQQYVIQPFTAFIANISAWVTQLFDSNVIAEGIVMRDSTSGAAVSIESGCNGVEAMICLTAAIIAFPASLNYKLWGLALGFLAIQSLNIVRIISLFYLLQWDKEIFEWAHLYLWQALIILDAFIVFIIWLRFLPETELASAA